ncbi:MAG: hypothetical protein HWN66_09155 [Candidatus Helarchaeota archaeon]|nr:hypothetical protein [Candidatus Helarchaeota archaeon]
MSETKIYDWILLYWMPYDNNLSPFRSTILKMLAKGVQSENILVLVQSDIFKQDPLSRSIITKDNVDTQQLNATNSASEEIFAEYLNWTKAQFSGKKWAIIFLGHGGNLDEISPDVHPVPDSSAGTQWMNIEKLNKVILDFNKKIDGQIELIFLQNCCKGTIEAHYTFRHAAKYTLSSQTPLGAPNFYYESLLQFLGQHPAISGSELTEKIMEFEDSGMYNSYTVTNNAAVCNLPLKINPLIESILSSNIKNIQISELSGKSWSYLYMDDRFADVISFFKWVVTQSSTDHQKLDVFINFLTKEMIHKFQESPKTKYPNLTGLSLCIPSSKKQLDKYKYLKVFSDLKLVELFDPILRN